MFVERVTKWYQLSTKLQLNPLFKDPLANFFLKKVWKKKIPLVAYVYRLPNIELSLTR